MKYAIMVSVLLLLASGQAEARYWSYDQCVAWKMQKRDPEKDEVQHVIHCNRIMDTYLRRLITKGADYAKERDRAGDYPMRAD